MRLTKRVREVVILAVGSVWKSKYELYAHGAVAKGRYRRGCNPNADGR